MNAQRTTGALCICAAIAAAPAGAQEALLPSTGWGIGTALSAWHLSTPIPQASGAVADVAEVAVPFRLRSTFGRWSFDLSGAAAFGGVHLGGQKAQGTSGEDGEDEDRLVTIVGPTDLKLRFTGPLPVAGVTMTAGVNIPTGKVGLDADETTALQAVGAPALRMPVGAFGTGAGVTLGVIRAITGDDWALALGGSVEQRNEYSPIALVLSGGRSETRVAPGMAVHATAGLDRALGDGRWSLLAVADVFAKDKVRLSAADSGANDYTLGPQVTVTSQVALAAPGWREATFTLAGRVRSEYADAAGAKVSGSSGTYFEGSFGGVKGGPTGAGFVVMLDGRWHSGLKFTDAMVGAATTAAGLTLGLERAGDATLRRYTIRGQYGTFDTGTAKSSGFGVTLGMSVAARREAR